MARKQAGVRKKKRGGAKAKAKAGAAKRTSSARSSAKRSAARARKGATAKRAGRAKGRKSTAARRKGNAARATRAGAKRKPAAKRGTRTARADLDFGIPADEATRRARRGEAFTGDRATHRAARSGSDDVPRDAGVGAPDDGPGSHSGGDVSTDFTGVGTNGGVAESGATTSHMANYDADGARDEEEDMENEEDREILAD